MADEPRKDEDSAPPKPDAEGAPREETGARDWGLSDRVRRAVSAGFEVASRSKDEVMRAAGVEIRSWLDHVDLQSEIRKALAGMTVEVKAEITFRPKETDDGKSGPDITADVRIKPES